MRLRQIAVVLVVLAASSALAGCCIRPWPYPCHRVPPCREDFIFLNDPDPDPPELTPGPISVPGLVEIHKIDSGAAVVLSDVTLIGWKYTASLDGREWVLLKPSAGWPVMVPIGEALVYKPIPNTTGIDGPRTLCAHKGQPPELDWKVRELLPNSQIDWCHCADGLCLDGLEL